MRNDGERVSINALEKYCEKSVAPPTECELVIGDGKSVVYTVKPCLTIKEAIDFIEDVVQTYIDQKDIMIVPIAKDFLVARNVLTYYANFSMPKDIKKQFDMVTGAMDIVDDVVSRINKKQFDMLIEAIDDRIDFEKNKMLSLQEEKVNYLISEVEKLVKNLSAMFRDVSGEQMADFVTGMAALSENGKITAQDLAKAIVTTSTGKS